MPYRHPSKCSPRRKAGQATLEAALMLPWLMVSFMGVVDLGMASYALISVQNAARAAGMYASSSYAIAQATQDNPATGTACTYALAEMQSFADVGTKVTTCGPSDPVKLTATYDTGPGNPNPWTNGIPPKVTIGVTYTVHLIALPVIMPSRLPITRTVVCPLRNPI